MNFRSALVLLVIAAICATLTVPVFAADGAAIFKTKCSACHGAEGQGKIGPALKGTSLSADDIANLLTKGNDAKKPPHKKPMNGLSDADAKAVGDFVKTLK
ncbi:MAG: cytochrome c [Candidatus Sulfotelmatobacter sp.]